MSSLCNSSFGGTGAPVVDVFGRAGLGGFGAGTVVGDRTLEVEGMTTVDVDGTTRESEGDGVDLLHGPTRHNSRPKRSKRVTIKSAVRSLRFMELHRA